jgi:EAL domain-containing protein (putative c-di-GMP-specific phosphodiesterase class I)/GGDEF domain-containing protein
VRSGTALARIPSRLFVLCGLALAAATVMPWLAGEAGGTVGDASARAAALWAGGVALAASVVAAVATWRLVRWRHAVGMFAAQAHAVAEGRTDAIGLPTIAELRPVAAALNRAATQARRLLELHAGEVDRLRRQVDQDILTGVARRAGFLARWGALLAREDGPAAGSLLVVRLADLAGLNRRLGRDGTDRALGVIAQLLQAYPARVPGCLVGRLNGADFALALPAAGVAAETGASIASALRAALGPFGRQVHVHVGGIEFARGAPVSELLAHADRALAIAEGREPFGVEVAAGDLPHIGGERDWHRRVADALEARAVRIARAPVLDAARRLVLLEAPMRLQLRPDGAFEPGAHWRALARRSGLLSQAERVAVSMVVDAVAGDGVARLLPIAPESLVDGSVTAHLQRMLLARPDVGERLWIGVPEAAVADRIDAVRQFARMLRPLGARVGVIDAELADGGTARLADLGAAFVVLDASRGRGISGCEAARAAMRATVALLHALSVRVHVAGVVDAADAEALFAAGVDAVGGAWTAGRVA